LSKGKVVKVAEDDDVGKRREGKEEGEDGAEVDKGEEIAVVSATNAVV
jgi:hypothetical protein